MQIDLSKWGPATVLIVAIALIVVAVGGVVVVVHPATLNFETYLDDLKVFAGAVGALGIARGLHLGLGGASGQAAPERVSGSTGDAEGPGDPDMLPHLSVSVDPARFDDVGDIGHPGVQA